MPQSHDVSSEELDCRIEGGVARLRLNRPAARNALNGALVDELDGRLALLDDDESVGAVVLAGAPPGFSAGSDVKELAGMTVADMARHEARTARVARSIQQLGTPVIAAVEGFALGGGFLLAVSCDLVVTTADARWHLPEVQLGWVPPWGLQALAARCGPVLTKRFSWGETSTTGADLHRLGVVEELAHSGGAESEALTIASRLAALPTAAVGATKHALADAVLAGAEVLDARANRMFAENCRTPEARTSLDRFAPTTAEESR
ncbi:enoyl-CoA hydratase/isomerase family protein [Streptomyces bathyalis]|uniref:Enoyl-CoA hydratase/isomerase family protein n=1 Tax=Streptomyces bathyalis TaxID=2710756 RepID=A0A7T1T2I7_9ACTN|nr:enoyl-CoA hydratase/isomerase family protein [Streptomyces bathyalis]QPP05218.1 enoyl-CoA hydratase/isomerase family protein [Streptomyces bathyalis]